MVLVVEGELEWRRDWTEHVGENVYPSFRGVEERAPGHPVLSVQGSVVQNSKSNRKGEKAVHTFVKQTNKSTWQREKGRVGDNT